MRPATVRHRILLVSGVIPQTRRASFVESKHPRVPKNFKGGGQFRRLLDRAFEALDEWMHERGPDNPFPPELFSDDQLRKISKALNLNVRRGAHRNEHINAILDWRREQPGPVKALGPPVPGPVGPRPDLHPSASELLPVRTDDPAINRLHDGAVSGVASHEDMSNGAFGHVERVTFNDGSVAVAKTAMRAHRHSVVDQADAEQLAALVGRSFGVSVPAVYRATPETVYMEFVPGPLAIDVPEMPQLIEQGRFDLDHNDSVHRMALLDILINNGDRAAWNWIYDADTNTARGIDHGGAWISTHSPADPPHFVQGFARFLATPNGRWDLSAYSPNDLAYVREQIIATRPDFEHAGHLDWYEFTIQRLDAMIPHATGTVDRIAPPGAHRIKAMAGPDPGRMPHVRDLFALDPDEPEQHAELMHRLARVVNADVGEFQVRLVLVGRGPRGLTFRATVHRNGLNVGLFSATFKSEADGTFSVVNPNMSIAPDVQGAGFAADYNARLIGWAASNGISQIRLYADVDVGGYAWARAGFDWDRDQLIVHPDILAGIKARIVGQLRGLPSDEEGLEPEIRELLARLELPLDDPRYPTPYEISQLGRKRGMGRRDMWFGKRVMLGSDWYGMLRLHG